ncbi:MAG: hypothetical protein AAFQ94_07010 [Bacteroidota bacterium]
MKNPKILKDHVIIYDNDCPLCNLYTGAFVKMNFLEQNGRLPYEKINQIDTSALEEERSKNEIPLFDLNTGTFDYGVNSLLKILGHRWSFFKKIATCRPAVYLIKILYNFISFNRKVIVPGDPKANTCYPTFNIKYRSAFLLFSWVTVAMVLYLYNHLLTGLAPAPDFNFELLIAGGQVLFQSIFLIKKDRETAFEYLGNMMTVSLLGAIGLLPMLLVSIFISINPIWALLYFSIIATLMFIEHYRRVKLLGLSTGLSISWVLYRVLILITLL